VDIAPPPDGLRPAKLRPLEGDDRFRGADSSILEFWRWAFSDLRDNTVRGIVAEYLVALAIGRTDDRRRTWGDCDVTTANGLRIEVKASGYLQGWFQRSHSKPAFGRVAGRTWDAATNVFGAHREIRADVFVFAVQTCLDPDLYDALDVAQWEFYVVAGAEVERYGYRSVGLAWVRKRADAVGFDGVAAAIEACSA
jgi:hypothetical protein